MSFFGLSALILSQIAQYAFYDEAEGLIPATLDVASFLMFIGCLSGVICIFSALVLQDYSKNGDYKEIEPPTSPVSQHHHHVTSTSSHQHHHHQHHLHANDSSAGTRDPAWTERSPLKPVMTSAVTPTVASSSTHPIVATQHSIQHSSRRNSKPDTSLLAKEGYTLPPPKTPISSPLASPFYPNTSGTHGQKAVAGSTYGTIDVRTRGIERPPPVAVVEVADRSSNPYQNEEVSCFVQLDAYILSFIMFSLAGVGLMVGIGGNDSCGLL